MFTLAFCRAGQITAILPISQAAALITWATGGDPTQVEADLANGVTFETEDHEYYAEPVAATQ